MWLKALKYLQWIPHMGIISMTLSKARRDISTFFLLFTVVFFAFAAMFHSVFSDNMEDFSTFGRSCYSMMKALGGDIEANDMYENSSVMGTMLLMVFLVLMIFVLLTMLIAIINDAFVEVKEDLHKQMEVS